MELERQRSRFCDNEPLQHFARWDEGREGGGGDPRREAEVLTLLADGLSNKEIAARLEISEHTAKFHVNSILQKMGAQKRVEAVVRAAKLGIIEL